MGLVACICPYCGGTVNMEEDLISGFCTFCGKQVINDKAVVGNVKVSMDRSGEVRNLLKLAKISMHDGDSSGAKTLLQKAMQINSMNSDVWYMDAVLDKVNKKSDMERAKSLPSLGIFSKEDVDIYWKFDKETTGILVFVIAFFLGFGVFCSTLVVGIVTEAIILIPIGLVSTALIIALSVLYWKKSKPRIPMPVFEDEVVASQQAAMDKVAAEMMFRDRNQKI